jgi:hypothetical protein
MNAVYTIDDIELGTPTQSGHEVYLKAIYTQPATNIQKAIIFKRNKHGQAKYSRFELLFTQLARLFLAKGLTTSQHLVIDYAGQTVGVAVEHLCYLIERNEGLNRFFYTLSMSEEESHCEAQSITQAKNIPIYFLDKLPQNFLSRLLLAEQNNQLLID